VKGNLPKRQRRKLLVASADGDPADKKPQGSLKGKVAEVKEGWCEGWLQAADQPTQLAKRSRP
jgi:hypothetical protein